MANKGVFSVVTLDYLQAEHWVRVDYYIMANWGHMLVIVQCQSDGCILSSKNGAVVRQSFGQVAAGCLTIKEMAVRLMTAAAPPLLFILFILEPSV